MKMEFWTKAGLAVLGVITAAPIAALLSPATLDYYGVTASDPMTLALLQHRGMLQLVLGAGLVWAAFFPPVRLALALGAITTKSTNLILTLGDPSVRPHAPMFSTVFDGVAVVLLGALAVVELRALHVHRRRRSENARML